MAGAASGAGQRSGKVAARVMRGVPAVARTWSVRRKSTDVTEYCEAGRARRGVRSQSSLGRCASWRSAGATGSG